MKKIRRFLRDLANVIRRQWWIARGERQRVIEERDRYKEAADFRFKQMKEAWHAVHMLKLEHLPASVDVLNAVADRIDCEPGCEYVSPFDWSTGVSECPRMDRGECPFDDACALRDLALALDTYRALTQPEEQG